MACNMDVTCQRHVRHLACVRYVPLHLTLVSSSTSAGRIFPAINTPSPAGEIDIAEARGNNYTYPSGGTNVAFSTTHWGPSVALDRAYRTTAGSPQLHSTFHDDFHTFGLEWSADYLYTYIDTRVRQVLKLNFGKQEGGLWSQGQFPQSWPNGSEVVDVWTEGTGSAPFDGAFYLVLSLAVGGE